MMSTFIFHHHRSIETQHWHLICWSTKCPGCLGSQKSLIDQHIGCSLCHFIQWLWYKSISKPWVMLMTLSLMSQTVQGRFSRFRAHKWPPSTTSSGCHHSSALLVVKTPQQTHPTTFPYMLLRPHMVLCDTRPGRSQITPEKLPVGLCYWSVYPFGFTTQTFHTYSDICVCENASCSPKAMYLEKSVAGSMQFICSG